MLLEAAVTLGRNRKFYVKLFFKKRQAIIYASKNFV